MPWVCMSLAEINLYAPFLFFSFIAFMTAIIDFALPRDTVGKGLDQDDTSEESDKKLKQSLIKNQY